MSLVGFQARNHPQQVRKNGARLAVDDRTTSPEVFEPLHRRFIFTVDAAASAANALLPRYWTEDDNALEQSWLGERVWCNPPYSLPGLRAWLEKAWAEFADHCPLIVMLLPANRTEQRWWQELIEPSRDRGIGLAVEFMPGRLRFIQRGRSEVGPDERPPFGCCLAIWYKPRPQLDECGRAHCRYGLHCRCERCHDAGRASVFPDLSEESRPNG